MGKMVLVCVVACALLAVSAADSSVCEGIWNVEKVERCDNHEQYPISWQLKKRKLDRNTDCFSLDLSLFEDFGADYGMRLESSEKCDGGYKLSDVMTGGACGMLKQFAKKNFEDVLERAEIQPKDCPIKKGNYSINDYVIDYKTLPEQAKCGEFRWDVFVTKNGKDMSCIRVYCTFTSKEEGNEDEDCEE